MDIKFKSVLDSPCGMRFMFSNLEIQSSFARHLLLESVMATSHKDIEKQYDELNEFISLFSENSPLHKVFDVLKNHLSNLKDIRTTLARISDSLLLDDIELFEIKNLAIINENIREYLKDIDFNYLEKLDDLSTVIKILDPEGHKINSFYIYDAYNAELKELRKIIGSGNSYDNEHLYRMAAIERKIREELGATLKKWVSSLNHSLYTLAKLDLLSAKMIQIQQLGLSIPSLTHAKNTYSGLFHPEVKERLTKNGATYQCIDLEFDNTSPVLITGANMGGKSLTLKTLALTQYLFQFGFGVPAKQACICPVENIMFSMGGEPDLQKGLSAFASEMLKINNIVKTIKSRQIILSLIDEPAGTTNPQEGTALLTALLKILGKYPSFSVITTHYNIENAACKRFRVKGLENNKMNYSLVETTCTTAPREAIMVAKSLNIDNEWLLLAEKELSRKN